MKDEGNKYYKLPWLQLAYLLEALLSRARMRAISAGKCLLVGTLLAVCNASIQFVPFMTSVDRTELT